MNAGGWCKESKDVSAMLMLIILVWIILVVSGIMCCTCIIWL